LEQTVLYDFITAHKAELLARARAKILGRKWPAVSAEELENGLPLFLTQLAETLRLKATSEPFPESAIGTTAGKHGSEALAAGFSVAQVVHDYGDICQAITEAAVEEKVAISSEDFQTLNLCLDNAIAGAVTEFSRQHEQSLGDGEAERLGHLTHELRNLLAMARLAWSSVKSGKVAVGGSTGAVVDRSLSGLRDLIDTAICEVRLAARTQVSKRISVARFLHEVESAASLDAEQRGMGLSVTAPGADVMIDVDPQLLSSALFNLLQNAFKYSNPDENVEAFFSPFGARRGKDRSGLGLGLSIGRKAVRTFGGDITVRNLPGKGCIFSIELPVPPTTKAAPGRTHAR
jgi:signal transduction histidine kinase